jgi:UDP-glucose:(heptosyl)LPS alpha-1,3-glucosyltransferase
MRLLVIARPFVFHGGVERATAGLVAALCEHGHQVEILGPPGQVPLAGVTVRRLSLPPLPAAARVLAFAAAARVAVARGRWDVIQSHERTLRQDIYRAGEGCHRAYLATRAPGGGRGLYHRVVLALERRTLTATPWIVAIARRGKREVEQLYGVAPGRVSVVYNGVDLDRFHPRNRERHRATARAEAGVPAAAWALLFLGSGFERKGLASAIQALAALRDGQSRLLVVGKGDTAAYRALAGRLGVAARVCWLGARPDPERWYAAADVVVLPARYEPFGNVHLEALASGVPVITSPAAGGSEVIEPDRNGAVVDPGKPGTIAAAIERLRDLATEETRAAARRSAEPFTYAAQVAGFERLYRRCAPNAGSA